VNKLIAMIGSAFLVLALAALVGVPVARAHAEIESCLPEIDSTVETAPETLVCTASQGMEVEGSTLSVFDANGVQVDSGDSQVDLDDPDRLKISVSLDTSKMTDGVYTVKWTTVSAEDGDEASGEFNFTVGHAMEATPSPTAKGDATAAPTAEGDATATPAPEATAEGGEEHEDHSVATGTIDGKEVTLRVVAPAKDAVLPAGDVTIEAAIEGMTLGENGTHLHFYLDEELAAMGEAGQQSHTVHLEPGNHDLEVGLATGEHEDALKAHVHVHVEDAATSAAPTTPLPATGAGVNYGVFALIALSGLVLFGLGAFVLGRARR
jgi:methionine-rich copper-binding protein CopC